MKSKTASVLLVIILICLSRNAGSQSTQGIDGYGIQNNSKIDSIIADMPASFTRMYPALSQYDRMRPTIESHLQNNISACDTAAVDSLLNDYLANNPAPDFEWRDNIELYRDELNNSMFAMVLSRQTRIQYLVLYAETKEGFERDKLIQQAFNVFFENRECNRDEKYQLLIYAKRYDIAIYKKLLEYGTQCMDEHSIVSLSNFIKVLTGE